MQVFWCLWFLLYLLSGHSLGSNAGKLLEYTCIWLLITIQGTPSTCLWVKTTDKYIEWRRKRGLQNIRTETKTKPQNQSQEQAHGQDRTVPAKPKRDLWLKKEWSTTSGQVIGLEWFVTFYKELFQRGSEDRSQISVGWKLQKGGRWEVIPVQELLPKGRKRGSQGNLWDLSGGLG